jgi:selenoprotein W-related protein
VAELLKLFEPEIETISLIPSDGGKFEVLVNKDLVYSKLATKRHVEPGEIAGIVQKIIEGRGSL